MRRRILSILLCCVMVVGLLPTVAFAEDAPACDTALYAQSGEADTYTVSDILDQTYTGVPIEPAVEVKNGNDTIDSSQYTVKYENNTNAGIATATVTVTVNPGTVNEKKLERKFSIVKDEKPTVEITLPEKLTYDGSEKTVTAVAKTSAGNEISDAKITVEYYDNEKCDGSAILVAPNAAVDFWAKVTLNGTDNYAEKIEVVKVSIAKATPTVSLKDRTDEYTGNPIEVNHATVRFGNDILSSKEDGNPNKPTITYEYYLDKECQNPCKSAPTEPGEYYVKATATFVDDSDYTTASTVARLTISRISINKPTAKDGQSLTYNGQDQTYVIEPANADDSRWYVVTDNVKKDAGSYVAKVELNDSYHQWADGSSGVIEFPYSIAKATPSVTLADKEATYTGSAIAANAASVKFNGNDIPGAAGSVTYKYYTNAECTQGESSEAPSAVGEYWVKATANFADDANFATTASPAAKLTIKAATIKGVEAAGWSGPYDGQLHGITVKAPEGATVKYGTVKGQCNLDASPTYADVCDSTVYYVVTMPGHKAVTGSAKVVIIKADLDMTGVKFEPASVAYNGEVQRLAISGNLPEGVKVDYVYEKDGKPVDVADVKNVGTYKVQAIFALSDALAKNYNVPASMTATLTIDKKRIDVPAADTTVFECNGKEQTYAIAESDWYSVDGNKQTAAGTYDVKVSLKDANNTVWSDGTSDAKVYKFTIFTMDDESGVGSDQGNAADNGSNTVDNGSAMAATADGVAGVAGVAAAMGAIALAGAAFAARRRHND